MEISINSHQLSRIILPWLLATAISLLILTLIHLIVFLIFYLDTRSLLEHFSGTWITLYFYALIWPGVIVNNYKSNTIVVKHQGEVVPEKLKNYFLQTNYTLLEEKPGFYRFEAKKWFDRLFKGSRNVIIQYDSNSLTIDLPANKTYNVHHGFKFGNLFIDQ